MSPRGRRPRTGPTRAGPERASPAPRARPRRPGSSARCSAARPRWAAARCPRAPASSPATARRFWHAMGFQNVEDDEAMFTEADLEALKRVARLIGEEPGQRGARPRDDPGLRAHLRPARRVADPARRRVADLPVLRGARGPRQPLGARAAGRRRRRRAARVDLRRHRAAARLRLAPPPHQRDRPHARGCRPGGALRPVGADPGRRVRRPRVVHVLRPPDERAAARAPRPALRAARQRRHHRARRPGHQDGGRRGAVRAHRRGGGIRHRPRPRRRDGRGRAAAAGARRPGPRPGRLTPRRRLRDDGQQGQPDHRRHPLRARLRRRGHGRGCWARCRASRPSNGAAGCCAGSAS